MDVPVTWCIGLYLFPVCEVNIESSMSGGHLLVCYHFYRLGGESAIESEILGSFEKTLLVKSLSYSSCSLELYLQWQMLSSNQGVGKLR